eukprot:COSAG02_NODE_4215_length_5621_cov_3.231800_1_plen_27_part_10
MKWQQNGVARIMKLYFSVNLLDSRRML